MIKRFLDTNISLVLFYLILILAKLILNPAPVGAVANSSILHNPNEVTFCQQAQVKDVSYNPDQGTLNVDLWDPINPTPPQDAQPGNMIIQKVNGNNITNLTSTNLTTTSSGFGFVFQVPANTFNTDFNNSGSSNFDTNLNLDIVFKPQANTNNQAGSCPQSITQSTTIQVAAQPQQNPATGGTTNGGTGGGTGVSGGNSLDDLKSILGSDKQVLKFGNLGGLVSGILEVVFVIAGFLMFIWALMGIFQYITAGGNKEGLAKARARITWAIVGFLFVVIAFALSRYIQEIIPTKQVPIQSVTSPRQDCPQPMFYDPTLVNPDGTTGRCSVR